MRHWAMAGLLSIAVLGAGCSESSDAVGYAADDSLQTVAIEEEVAEAVADGSATMQSLDIPSGANAEPAAPQTPQIAYTYDYGFRIKADEISALAQSHVELCEKLGPANCRVISLRQSGSEGSYADGQLELAVAAGKAKNFGNDLSQAAEGMGGEQISVSIAGEDLSKQIVDTEARLRARRLLRDRLMEVLRSRAGSVAELVEAERGVAQVNEEIDQAQSWLAEMKGRVAFSDVSISYSSSARAGGSFTRPIVDAFQSIGQILGTTIGAIIVGMTVLLPLLLLILGLRWVLHRFGLRLRFWKKDESAAPSAD